MNRFVLIALKNLTKIPGLYTKLCRYANNPDAYPEQERWDHIRRMMKLAVESGNLELSVTGTEHIPAHGQGFMMYANHQGLFDVVAIAATCASPIGAVFKKELKNTPFLKQVIACTKAFAMDREDVRQSLTVIQKVTEEVKAGRAYLIFPEGTRSKNGNVMGDFHGGSFRCALKAKCPILPVVLIDSFKVFDQKGSDRLCVQIHYLPPIPYERFAHMKATEVAALVKEQIEQTIRTHTDQLS